MMGRVVTGLALTALGVLFLLDALEVLATGDVVADWWPLIIVAIGVGNMVESRFRGGGLTTLVVGLVLLGFTTGVLTGDAVATLWPVALILLGLWIAFGRTVTRSPAPTVGQTLDEFVVFSGKEIHATHDAFRGGRVTALFGGIDVDLRMARLHPEGAVLEAVGVFGGVDVVVPRGWRVEVSGPAVFGGWENKTAAASPGAPLLVVKAVAVFGGVEVKTDVAVPAGDRSQAGSDAPG